MKKKRIPIYIYTHIQRVYYLLYNNEGEITKHILLQNKT